MITRKNLLQAWVLFESSTLEHGSHCNPAFRHQRREFYIIEIYV